MKKRSKKSYNLGIICPNDFLNEVRGGAAGFISNTMNNYTANRVAIFGISISNIDPWKFLPMNGKVNFVSICHLKYPSKIPMRLKVLFYYLKYRNVIISNDIDILYIHSPETCLPFIFFKKIPVIYHQHGAGNTVALSRFKYARSFFFQGVFQLIYKCIFRNADWIISIDNLCYEQAINNNAGKKTTLLRNAVDVARYRPDDNLRRNTRQKYKIQQDQYVILFVGRIEKPKGVLHLLKCVSHLNLKKIKFHIFFAGDGSYLSFAQNYVNQNNINDYVTFLGSVDHHKLPSYYNMADVMVLPSDMEGIPMVILESLACGTPVVASRVGGIPDIVYHGKNGFLVDDLSPDNLSQMIIKAFGLGEGRKAISASVEKFSSIEYMNRFDTIVRKILYSF